VIDGIPVPVGPESRCRRPCPQVAQELISCPVVFHAHGGQGQLFQGKKNVPVAGIHVDALRRPVITEQFPVKPINQPVDARADTGQLIADRGKQTALFQHPPGLAEEGRGGKPVQGLRREDEVDGIRIDARISGIGDPVFDILTRNRPADLFGARVAGNDPVEKCRQPRRGLARAGAAVPGKCIAGGQAGQDPEKLFRPGRPVACIVAGDAGEK